MKKVNVRKLALAIALPLIVGGLSAFLTRDAMFVFDSFKKPPLSPPGFLFPIVWTILYVLMGISSYLVYETEAKAGVIVVFKNRTLVLYVVQLTFNFFWSILFFKFALYKVAFVWLVILWILVFSYIRCSFKLNKLAAYLMISYLRWMTFAGYLNIMIAILN